MGRPGKAGWAGTTITGSSKMNTKVKPKERYVVPVMYTVDKTCAADVANCAPTKKQVAARDKEVGTITKQYAAAGITPEELAIIPLEYQQVLQQKYKFAFRFPSTGMMALVYCLVGISGSCLPRHQPHARPSFLELNGVT